MPCINWCSSFTPPPSSTASSLSIASNFSGKASHFLLIVARCIVGGCRINYLVQCLRQGAGWHKGVQEEGGGGGRDGGEGEGVEGEGRSSSGPEHHMSISNSVCKTTINQIGTIASIYQIITARRLCYDDQGQPDVTRVNHHMQGGEQ